VLRIAERAAELLLHEHLGFDVSAEKAHSGLRKAEGLLAEVPIVADSWTVSRLRAILGEDLTLMQAVNFLGGSAPEEGLLSWQGRAGPGYALALVAALLMGAAIAAIAFAGYRRRAETRGTSFYSPLAA